MQISQEDSDCHQMASPKCDYPTKRRSRTPSPENSSCSTAGGGGGGVCYSSPAIDEDKAMADCLILLARGGSGSRGHIAAETEDGGDGCRGLAGGGQAEPFVYQCKTCDRNFPSFQALGGHRASHKKPRTGFGADEKEGARNHTVGIAALKNSKIHECSVCGSEFASGQALGGHMRRHRPPPHAIRYPTEPPTRGYGAAPSDGREEPRGMIPALDLNLPPPIEEEDGHDLKMRNLAFSTPPLVDCHY